MTDNNPLEMQMNYQVSHDSGDSLDLIEFVSALHRSWIWILLAALSTGAAGYGLTHLLEERYEAVIKLNLVEPEEPGGVTPDDRRAPEVLTLVEHGFIMGSVSENYRSTMMARLRSRRFTDQFIEQHDIARHLFPELWSDTRNRWLDRSPDPNLVYKVFHENIRFVEHNPETDIISIRIRYVDPDAAARWANAYVEQFNRYMRDLALNEVENKRRFLYAELEKTDIVEMHKSIYRLVEAQTAVAMLASSRKEYALEVVDPAYRPFERFSPARKRIALISFGGGLMFSIFWIFFSVLVKRLGKALRDYKLETG